MLTSLIIKDRNIDFYILNSLKINTTNERKGGKKIENMKCV